MSELNGQENKQRGLKQDDFRKLLQTPRPGDAPSKGILGMATPRQRIPPQTPKPGGSGVFAKPEIPASKSKKKYKRPDTSEEKSSDNKYRDRAAERRTGANPDYQETEQILKALNNSETLEAKLVYEQSKYLGGDTEYTHLVKGLDFALLNKVRNEIQKGGDDQKDEELDEVLERIKEESQEVPKMNSKMAQNIYDIAVISAKKPPKINELFVAGRMAYVFELADENGYYGDPFAIPTTVIRSKADIADSSGVDKSTNDLVIEKISRVMAYVRKGSRDGGVEVKDKKLKKKVKEKQPEPVVPVKYAAIDDSEDIFEDAGRDYTVVPDEPTVEENNKEEDEPMIGPLRPPAQSVEVDTLKGYFKASQVDNDAMDIDGEEPKNEDLKTLINQVASASGINQIEETVKNSEMSDDNKSSAKSEAVKKRLYEYDGYEGNYSTYGLGLSSLGGEGTRKNAYDSGHEDSDSEEEVHTIRDQGVAKNKKAQLSRWDFDTEEEWLSYKDNVTAMPKSAFQFGVKKTDGRKTRRSGKELSEKQKLDRDWQKISKIMEQKYGDGDEGGSSKKKAKHE